MELINCPICNSANFSFYLKLKDRFNVTDTEFSLVKCGCSFIYLNPRISNITITRPSNIESTAIGSAILAGVKNSFWDSIEEPFKYKKNNKNYTPGMNISTRNELIKGWKLSVQTINK